jgi:hypothetical protein
MSEGAREAGRLTVFLSYSRDDLNFADQLEAALQAHKYDVALDRQGISGAGRELPLRNPHLRFSDLPPLRCVHRGHLGNDGGSTRGGQCELLERSWALHVGSCGSRL